MLNPKKLTDTRPVPYGFNASSPGSRQYLRLMKEDKLRQTFADEPLQAIDRRLQANMSQSWYVFNLGMEGLETYLKIKDCTSFPTTYLERFVAALWLTVLSNKHDGSLNPPPAEELKSDVRNLICETFKILADE